MRRRSPWPLLVAVPLVWGCGSTTSHDTPAERGARDADDPHALSTSQFNAFACTTCHAKPGDSSERIFPGASLEGATSRPSYWGGRYTWLGDAVGECITHFERTGSFDPTTPAAEDLYSYLESIGSGGNLGAIPFTVVRVITDLPPGDAQHGRTVWDHGCRICHGDPHTGNGRLSPLVSIVPEATISYHGADGPVVVREVIIEKIRNGSFLGFAGVMPPFSLELMKDADISDLLTYLGL